MITDTRITVETPEGADLPLDPAGVGVRISAFLIDALIKMALTAAVSILIALLGKAGFGVYLIAYFLIEWFYPVFFEVTRQGQTIGKKSMSICVVNDDGTPVVFSASLIRNLLRVVDFLPFFYVLGIVTTVWSPHFKRIGDLAAGTVVVYRRNKAELPKLDIKEKMPVPTDFTTDEQRALLGFAERSKQLSEERQQELAAILAPVLGQQKNTVDTINKMANSMVGE